MDNQIYITTSIGITVFPEDSSDPHELLKFCDFAMYKSKHNGKNTSIFFDKQIAEAYFRKILIESELKNSITKNYLTTLPVNTLKIYKLFVDNIESNKNRAVIKSIVNLSKSLKYKIVTEGVETKEQLDLLTDLGCNIIQGYYFSKPLPENEIENLLKSQS